MTIDICHSKWLSLNRWRSSMQSPSVSGVIFLPTIWFLQMCTPEHTWFVHLNLTQTAGKDYKQVTYEQRISWHNCFVTIKYAMHLNIIRHNDDDLLLDKDGWIGKVSLKLFPVKERLMRLRWFPSSFLFLSLPFQILKPALSFHLDKVFWRVSEWRSIAEFMIFKRQTTESK